MLLEAVVASRDAEAAIDTALKAVNRVYVERVQGFLTSASANIDFDGGEDAACFLHKLPS